MTRRTGLNPGYEARRAEYDRKNTETLERVKDTVPTVEWMSLFHIALLKVMDRINPADFEAFLLHAAESVSSRLDVCPHCRRRGVTRDLYGENRCGFCHMLPGEDLAVASIRRMDLAARTQAAEFRFFCRRNQDFGATPQIARVQG